MFTYVIKSSVGQLYKIGRTKDIEKRLVQIKGSMSFVDLDIVYVMDYDCESVLHSYFYEKRFKGEWFNLSDLDVDLIKSKDWRNLPPIRRETDRHHLEFITHYQIDIKSIIGNLSQHALRVFGYACSYMDKNNLAILRAYSLRDHFNYKTSNLICKALSELCDKHILIKTGRKDTEFMISPIFAINDKSYWYFGSEIRIDIRFDRRKDKTYWFKEILGI